jgi:hypothetical protein
MRVLFVNENIGGHVTVHNNLRRSLTNRPDVDATFYNVPAPGLVRKVAAARYRAWHGSTWTCSPCVTSSPSAARPSDISPGLGHLSSNLFEGFPAPQCDTGHGSSVPYLTDSSPSDRHHRAWKRSDGGVNYARAIAGS